MASGLFTCILKVWGSVSPWSGVPVASGCPDGVTQGPDLEGPGVAQGPYLQGVAALTLLRVLTYRALVLLRVLTYRAWLHSLFVDCIFIFRFCSGSLP